jgi:hypothetical protein
MNWTRAHDAHIARECEGLEISTIDLRDGGLVHHDQNGKWMAHYNSDPAACIRAAEAWAAKDPEYRTWTMARAGTLLAQCTDDGHQYIHEGEDGLAWALYEATGGPA